MRVLVPVLAMLFLTVASATAEAQVWLEDRDQREGPGFKVSDSLVLHIGLGLEGGYDTNAFLKDSDVDPAGRLRIAPYVDLATRSKSRKVQDDGALAVAKPKANFRLGVAAYYDHHFPVSDGTSIKDLNGVNGIGIDTHLNFVLFPEGNFSLLADLSYLRTLQPYESASDARARQVAKPGVGIRIRPGGGTLSFELGYRLDFMYFEDATLGDNNNRHAHDVRFQTSWKMFPKTALISKINFTPTLYYGNANINESSLPVRSLFGVQGLITDRFGLKLLAGYGASFYEAGPNFDSVLAEGELMFFITPFSNVRLGGQRDFVDSFYANYFVKNGGYLSYSQMFGGAFLVTLKGDVFYRDYARNTGPWAGNDPAAGVIVVGNPAERADVWAGGTLLLEYRITDWISVHASGAYMGDVTNFSYTYTVETPVGSGNTTTTTYPADFQKFEVFAGVRAHY